MSDKLIFRSFKDGDYKVILEWWKWWWGEKRCVRRDLLPHDDYCYMVEKNNERIAAAFLYVDKNAPMAYLTFMVSNPDYREKDRRFILEQLIVNIEEEAKSQGIELIFTVCGNPHVESIHNKLGWTIDKNVPAYETFKYI
tara:strand:+ start:681 stop:1100 length:420 start_codon:yes stop_codon:yes gene_type:complete